MKKGETTLDGKKYEFVYPEALEIEMKHQMAEIFDEQMYKLGRRKKDAVYIDIGANVGNASRYFAPYAKKIYSIEPNPTIYKALVENTKDYDNIETFNVAIGAYSGYDYMYSNGAGSLEQTFWGDNDSVNSVRVKVMDIADFFNENNIEHVDVMKIDVEGAEYIILPSEPFARVSKNIDFIIGESHFQNNGGFPDVIEHMLKDYGYKTTILKDLPMNYFRRFVYNNTLTGDRKEYKVPYHTMFTAEK